MNDLIDRAWVLKNMRFAYDADVVRKAPRVDAEPVRHGRWDDSGRYKFKNGEIAICCTECGCALHADEFRMCNWNYCPVCGANMDGEANV